MPQTILPFHRPHAIADNIRVVPQTQNQYSLLVGDDMCTSTFLQLSAHYNVTHYQPDLPAENYDAIILDCRGQAIAFSENYQSINFDIAFALIDESSYLPLKPTEKDTTLEIISEYELNSDMLALRIEARLRTEAIKNRQSDSNDQENLLLGVRNNKPDNNEPDIVKENAYEILQALLSYSTDWMVIKDLDHRFALVTDSFLRSHDKVLDEVIGKNDLEIGTPEALVLGDNEQNWTGYWSEDDRAIASQEPCESEQLIKNENALNQLREHVARVPIKNKDGEVIALLVCVTQINTSKFNGDAVSTIASRQNIERSPIIKQLQDDKNKAEAQILQSQSAIKRKNNFIATASHDLRQPLHAIGLFIESLQQQITDAGQQQILSKMKQSSTDLNELLNSILDMSKLDADAVTVDKSHFSIANILKSIEDEFETAARQKSISFNINSSNSFVHTDSLLLSRILRNLISNAVKYTESGSVNLLTEIEGDNLIIRVKDSGPGIPKEQYQAIFLDYHQLPDQHTQPNFGQGLGLSIVKRLVELLKLDISLDSDTGKGTQFSLSVPLGNSSNEQSRERLTTPLQAIDAYKLMVIDDNPTVLESMTDMLSNLNCDAYPALDIPEALEIITELEDLPDLLIVDYQLADGVTADMAIENIRTAANKHIPAIIVTGNTNLSLIRKAAESAYRVLNKPVNPDVLLRTISSAIEHQVPA